MKDLGMYKTADQKSYRCHFDEEKKEAFAMGPLPEMGAAYRVEAENESEAVEKLSGEMGRGEMLAPEGGG